MIYMVLFVAAALVIVIVVIVIFMVLLISSMLSQLGPVGNTDFQRMLEGGGRFF
jgi:hypothetical protein